MSCKIEGCDHEIRYSGIQICNAHYIGFLKTGGYDLSTKPDSMVFDGTTYKVPRGFHVSSDTTWRVTYKKARNSDVITQLIAMREACKAAGVYATTTTLCISLSSRIDISTSTIQNIVLVEKMGSTLHPTGGTKYLSRKIVEITMPIIDEEQVDFINEPVKTDFRTCAW